MAARDNVHELRCTNRGFEVARGSLLAAWQDDMFLQVPWFVPELIANFAAYPELGLLCLSRGLDCAPCADPIERWEDLTDWRRLKSTIGQVPGNWLRLQEVDAVLRPWVVRRACLDRVGSSTRRSARRNGTKPTWRSGSVRPDGRWRRAATSGSAPTFISGSTTLGTPSDGVQASASSRTGVCSMRAGTP